MNDKFDYVYYRGHWMRNEPLEDRLTVGKVLETALGFIALAFCLVAVIMLFLCGEPGVQP
jgi:hypothetical protein